MAVLIPSVHQKDGFRQGRGGRSVLRESVRREQQLERTTSATDTYKVQSYPVETPAHYCCVETCQKEVFNHLFLSYKKLGEVLCDACAVKEAIAPKPSLVYRRYTVRDLEAWLASFEKHYFV